MRGFVFLLSFGLVACAAAHSVSPASASSEVREWQTVTGKSPSKNEFAAVVAACEDRAKSLAKGDPIDACLADYGLRRVQ